MHIYIYICIYIYIYCFSARNVINPLNTLRGGVVIIKRDSTGISTVSFPFASNGTVRQCIGFFCKRFLCFNTKHILFLVCPSYGDLNTPLKHGLKTTLAEMPQRYQRNMWGLISSRPMPLLAHFRSQVHQQRGTLDCYRSLCQSPLPFFFVTGQTGT